MSNPVDHVSSFADEIHVRRADEIAKTLRTGYSIPQASLAINPARRVRKRRKTGRAREETTVCRGAVLASSKMSNIEHSSLRGGFRTRWVCRPYMIVVHSFLRRMGVTADVTL
jgi:hypothetical protein